MFCTMVTSDERAAVVALARQGDRPWHHYSELIESAESAIAVLHGDVSDSPEDELTLFAAEALAPAPDLGEIERELREWASEGMRVVTVLDAEYPSNLRTIYNRPPLLFVRGELQASDALSVAVVGTRTPTREGLVSARHMAESLGESGYTVVSGLAAGIDTAAHSAALGARRRTVAVVGTGLRRAYPSENAELQQRIAADGAVISQFWPDAPPARQHFPMRNVVMSGVALATVVIEAGNTSGARMQARFALEHGRPVFLMSSLLAHDWARRHAERPGVYVVDSASDVVATLSRLTALTGLSV